jgi:hypothetical protein
LEQARLEWERTLKPARVFVEFEHETVSGSWSRQRRVVTKAEHIDGKSNPRFVVTSLPAEWWADRALYEDLYCARGDMENRVKEQFVLFADRVSASTMRANQLRIYLSVIAYTLMCGLSRLGLKTTELATAQVGTIRLRLLKIGAQIRVTVRKVWVHMAGSYPYQALYQHVWQQLRCLTQKRVLKARVFTKRLFSRIGCPRPNQLRSRELNSSGEFSAARPPSQRIFF